jgi:hypothetical protein
MRHLLFLICCSLCFTSCSLEKRLYRKGYYIDVNRPTLCPQISERRKDSVCESEAALIPRCEEYVIAEQDTIAEAVLTDTVPLGFSQTIKRTDISLSSLPETQSAEEPVKEVKKSDRWKFAGLAVLAAAIGILLVYLFGSTLLLPGVVFVYSAIVLGTVIYFICCSVRDHNRFKDVNPETGKQQPLQWLIRISLYLLALAGAVFIARYALFIALF